MLRRLYEHKRPPERVAAKRVPVTPTVPVLTGPPVCQRQARHIDDRDEFIRLVTMY